MTNDEKAMEEAWVRHVESGYDGIPDEELTQTQKAMKNWRIKKGPPPDFKAGYKAASPEWVKIEELGNYFDFSKHEEFDEIERLAVTGGTTWEMVKLTTMCDYASEKEPLLPAFITYGQYIDTEFVHETAFTHFMLPPPLPETE